MLSRAAVTVTQYSQTKSLHLDIFLSTLEILGLDLMYKCRHKDILLAY